MRKNKNQDLAPAMAPGQFRMKFLTRPERPGFQATSAKLQAASTKHQAPDPEGIRNF
jgi:hypothetical protein